MDNKQFNILTKSSNVEYMRLFGYIPCITDYSYSRMEYIQYLERAVTEHRELSTYLEKLFVPSTFETKCVNNYVQMSLIDDSDVFVED